MHKPRPLKAAKVSPVKAAPLAAHKAAALERLAQEKVYACNRGEDADAIDKTQRVLAKNPRYLMTLITVGIVHHRRRAWQEA